MYKRYERVIKIGFILILGLFFFKVCDFLLSDENEYQLIVEIQTPKSDTYQVYWTTKEHAYEANKYKNIDVQGSKEFQTLDVKIKSDEKINFIRLDLGSKPEAINIKIKRIKIINRSSFITIKGNELLKYFYINHHLSFDSAQSTLLTHIIPNNSLPHDPFIYSQNLNEMPFQGNNFSKSSVYLYTFLFVCFVTLAIFKIS